VISYNSIVAPEGTVPLIPLEEAHEVIVVLEKEGDAGIEEHPAVTLLDWRHSDSAFATAFAKKTSPVVTVGTVMFHVFPVVTVVVFTTDVTFAVVLYRVMVAVEGFVASILVQVPDTVIDDPVLIGELTTGAAVQTAPTELIPEPVMLMAGCALTTVAQAPATVVFASSIP
jgi:hypothetical protein